MLELKVFNADGEQVDTVALDEDLLAGKVNRALLRQVLIMYEANRHVGLAKSKKLGEVKSSGRKMYRQKGTGRARAGQRRSPIRVGGGVAHGPKPRDFRQRLPVKARRRALQSALLGKMQDGEVILLDAMTLPEAKTRHVASILRNLKVDGRFLLVTPDYDAQLLKCTRNIEGAALSEVRSLNAWGVVVPKKVIFLRAAFEGLVEMLATWKERGLKERGPKEVAVSS